MALTKNTYVAKWGMTAAATLANVSITAVSVYHASRQADKIAKELGVTKTPRTIQHKGQMVEQLDTGLSKHARYGRHLGAAH